jgi:hypothetical protein
MTIRNKNGKNFHQEILSIAGSGYPENPVRLLIDLRESQY